MIAIIFIASNFKSNHHQHHHPQYFQGQLVRSPSLLERVKSVNFSSFYATTSEPHGITGYDSVGQLTRLPSFLERVKSIDLSFSSFYTPPPIDHLQSHESHQHDSEETRYDSPSQLTRVPSLLERVKSFKLLSPNYDSPSQLTRVPSLLERVTSFKLPSPFNSDHQSGDVSFDKDENSDMADRDPQHGCDEPKTSDVAAAKKRPTVITKSRSEKRMPEPDEDEEDVDRRRPATMKAAIGGKDECVDAKADDFIRRFKQQLKLQRLESLQRFREMLNGGTSV
ncbi:hypothetical protein L6452_26439 [Arctium lappa]|uniref:Uncharacterized protein n=1 Tax=Arctium lappa TaxID=4217 RepID=A0ACB8ZVK4_ARCLA|nr:hypothetical protein L6452_26439 [Arctium lappa]